jgi:hypothetical protein
MPIWNGYCDFLMPISADLDDYNVKIGYGFSGDSLTLVGTKEKLSKIAVSVLGPERDFLTTKREKFHNLWIKRNVGKLYDVPSYDAKWISSDIKRDIEMLDFYEINSRNLQKIDSENSGEFIRYMQEKNLYHPIDIISIANNNLFKVNIPLPNNATIGTYLVNVLSFDDNNAVDAKTVLSFDITHSDFNKFLYTVNKEYHKLYVLILLVSSCLVVFLIRYIFVKKS